MISPPVACAVAMLLGILHASGHAVLMCGSIAVPALAFRQSSRTTAVATMTSYYLGATWPIVVVTDNYLQAPTAWMSGLALWWAAVILLSSPYGLSWSPHRRRAAMGALTCLVLSVLPPLGVVGFASPLVSAGLLFPGTGWTGVLLSLLLPAAAILWPKRTILIGATATAISLTLPQPSASHSWQGTSVSAEHFGDSPLQDLERLQWVSATAGASTAQVVVFPENIIENWTDATDLFWREMDADLAAKGKVALIGATVHTKNGSANMVLVRGARHGSFQQRVPVPIGMWTPLADHGYELQMFGPGTVQIGGIKAAILICYEQFIPIPFLFSARENPGMFVVIANERWIAGTPLSRYSRSARENWSRLFSAPLVFAAICSKQL